MIIFKYMRLKFILKALSGIVLSSLFVSCAGSSNGEDLEVPTNLPPICRDIDFVAQPDMREMCGVRQVHYKAYKNIPQQRYLIKPSETSIVKTNGKLELRFQNSLPIDLEGPITKELEFSQDKRLEKIKNTYDYHEIYAAGNKRIRIFKMGIPTDAGTFYTYCFEIPEKKGNARTRSKAMGTNITMIDCADYNKLLEQNTKKK